MSNREIATLAFRVTGIWILVRGIEHLAYAIACLMNKQSSSTYASGLTTPEGYYLAWGICYAALSFILLAAGCVIFLSSEIIAAKTFPIEEESSPRHLGLHAFIYSVVGVVLLVIGIPHLATGLFRVFRTKSWSSTTFIIALLEPLLETTLGIALFLGSHGLVGVWTRLRYSGLRRQLGMCVHCGYDLAGNTTGRCPECGTPTNAVAEELQMLPPSPGQSPDPKA